MVNRFLTPRNDIFSPGEPLGTFQREMSRVFDEVFRGFPSFRTGAGMPSFVPDMEVRETEKGLMLTAELPGLSENDIDLKIEGDLLTLSGEKRQERSEEKEGVHLSERSYGQFRRSFRLPFQPDPRQVEAEFDKGVLRVRLPRPAEMQQPNRIPIRGQTGQSGAGAGEAPQAANEPNRSQGGKAA